MSKRLRQRPDLNFDANRESSTTQVSASKSSGIEVKFGVRLKHARLMHGLSLRELATKIGCSESFVSKVENDKARPSLAMLHRFASALNINIASLFSGVDHNHPVSITSADSRCIIQTCTADGRSAVRLERLIPSGPNSLLDANIHCVEPGGESEGTIEHEGEELGFLLEGELELEVQGVVYRLKPGDCFYFHSRLPHSYRNHGTTTARVLWVCTPPTF